jgi:hypothetical protein
MVKKIQNSKSNTNHKSNSIVHNVYLLYFLFVATIIHLGYFILTKESTLLASFSLAILLIYLVNPNMVIVLTTSIIFVDMLYLVKKVPEGFEDSSGSNIDSSGSNVDSSGSKVEPFSEKNEEGEEKKEKEKKPFTISNLISKISEIRKEEEFENKSNVRENLTGNSIEEVNKDFVDIKSMINSVKKSSPEITDSLKSPNTIDINEINNLINQLSKLTKNITKNGD